MTKVKNIRSLNEDVDSMTDVEKEKLIFIMMDLDHFKRINDHYGHITGNRALIFFSKKITTFLSEAHQDQVEVYRYGGEEFLVIFKDSTLKSVQKTILRFQAFLLKNKLWNGNSFFDKFYKVQNFFPYAIPIVLDNEPPRM